jgi:hypothetical protein
VRRAAGEEFLIAINCSNRGYSGRVQVAAGSSWTEETRSKSGGSLPELVLGGWEFRIFRHALEGRLKPAPHLASVAQALPPANPMVRDLSHNL